MSQNSEDRNDDAGRNISAEDAKRDVKAKSEAGAKRDVKAKSKAGAKRDVKAKSEVGAKRDVKAKSEAGAKRDVKAKDEDCAKHDVFTAAKRSQIMSKVRSTGNASTELKLIAEFKERKITGWRRYSTIFGRPDFLFPKLRVAVFVDGCFWHGHDCRNTKPKDNADYWRAKIERNRRRDRAATERLTELGYLVVRIWECDFKKTNRDRLDAKLAPIADAFNRWKNASTPLK